MSLWQKIKHLFTRKHRLPHVDIAFVRWYSRQSCAWSKWRAIENPNILNSDPEVYAKIAGGQRIQIHYGHATDDMVIHRELVRV